MATGGVREVGVRLKVGAEGTDNITRLGQALQKLGVDTNALDREAEELGRQLTDTSQGAGKAAIDTDKLADVQKEAATAAKQLADASKLAAGGNKDLALSSEEAKAQLSNMKLELAAAGASLYTIGRAIGAATLEASGFETAIAEIATLSEDTSQIDAQAEAVRRLAREYGGTAQGQAKALYEIISSGAKQGSEAIGILDAANKLAVGGITDVETAAGTLSQVINAYGLAAGDATRVSDALFATVRDGVTTVPELAASIGQVAPIASQAGVGLEQLLAATAALTKGNGNTSQSVTQLRAIITSILSPTAEATRTAGELGIAFDLQSLKAKGLAGFLEDVRKRTGGNQEVMAKLFGSVEALGGVFSLTGTQAGDFSNGLKVQAEAAGLTEAAFRKVAETSGFAGKQFQSALADLRISLGQTVTSLTPLLRLVNDALASFNTLPEGVKTGTVAFAALALAAGPLLAAVTNVTRATRLAATALGVKAGAATAVVAPATAAAGAATALGAASAAAAPGIAGAAGATTLLSRAVTLLKGALGIGLITTVVGLGLEFFRAKKEAEDLEKQVEDTFKSKPDTGAVKNAQDLGQAVQETGTEAERAAKKLDEQAAAARNAAQALGVDLARSAGRVSAEFENKLNRLNEVIAGLGALKTQGVDTGNLVAEALRKMVESARNTQELDALRGKIVQLGTSGEISKGQVEGLMKAVDDEARKATKGLDELGEAYKRLGVTSKAELDKTAADNKRAWELIKADATASVAVKQAAFKRYADSAIAANGGVADSTIKAEAQSLKLAVQADKTGKAIVTGMEQASQATEQTKKKFNELGQEINDAGEAINQLAGGINGARTRTEDLLGTASREARNARVPTGPSAGSFGELLNNTPSGGITRTVDTGQAVNRPSGGEWTYTLTGFSVAGRDAAGNPLAGGWVRVSRPSAITAEPFGGMQQLPFGGLVPRGSVGGFSPAGAPPFGTRPAPAPAPQPAPQPAPAPEPEGRATPSSVVEIRLTGPTGRVATVQAPNQSAADDLAAVLQDAFRANGGSLQ